MNGSIPGVDSPADTDAPDTQNTDGLKPYQRQAAGLTKYQLRALAIIADASTPPSGRDIKRALESYYGSDEQDSRVYRNLDALVSDDLVEKRDRDGRTTEYRVTEQGAAILAYEIGWLRQRASDRPHGSYLPAETEDYEVTDDD